MQNIFITKEIKLNYIIKNGGYYNIKQTLKKCGYPDWAVKSHQKVKKNKVNRRENQQPSRRSRVTLPYVAGISEKIRRVLAEHNITSHFKPYNTIRNILVHPKDKLPKEKKPNVIYGIKCGEPKCNETYIGETSQPLAKRMYQHRRPSSSGYDSAVFTHLHTTGHQFANEDVIILDSEENWFERGVKEAIYERRERPALNRNGGLRFNLSHAWDKTIEGVPRVLSARG